MKHFAFGGLAEKRLAFIDFEASSLEGGSYPIEVGWAIPGGPSGSRLIVPEWNWTGWSPKSAAIHGITREDLRRNGVSASEAMRALITAVGDADSWWSDAAAFDQYWLNRLADAADETIPFALADTGLLFATQATATGKDLEAIERKALVRYPTLHRARPDAERLAEVWNLLTGKAK